MHSVDVTLFLPFFYRQIFFMKFVNRNITSLENFFEIVFKNNSNTEDISSASEHIVIYLYGIMTNSLKQLPLPTFPKIIEEHNFFSSPVPPTSDATKYHRLRTHYQVQQWKENI